MNEKAILSEIRHPFVNRLLRTFKDRHYLYMLLEVVLGGELFTVLKRKGKLPDDDARFYASNITLFFEIMHKHHTVYRDLKPEVCSAATAQPLSFCRRCTPSKGSFWELELGTGDGGESPAASAISTAIVGAFSAAHTLRAWL